jgi:hypothetical protein
VAGGVVVVLADNLQRDPANLVLFETNFCHPTVGQNFDEYGPVCFPNQDQASCEQQ